MNDFGVTMSLIDALHEARGVDLALRQAAALADEHDWAGICALGTQFVDYLDVTLTGVPERALARRLDRERAYHLTLALIRRVDTALDAARDLAFGLEEAGAEVLDGARNHARQLVGALKGSSIDLHDLRRSLTPAKMRHAPVRSACRVTRYAVRLLPAAHRARYAEEYAGELGELAARGATRRQQWDYAAQVLFNAPLLRRSLRAPVRRPAPDR